MVSIGPKIQITGENSYRLSIRRIIQETKELNTEMDLMVAKFDKHESAMSKNKKMQELYSKQIDSSRKQLSEFRTGLDMASKKHEDAKKAVIENKENLEKLRGEYYHTETVVKKLSNEYGENNKYVQAAKKHQDELAGKIKDAEDATRGLDDEVNRSGRVLADWESQTNKARIELAELQQQMKDSSVLKGFGEDLQNAGDKMVEFGEAMSKYVTAPLLALGGYAVKSAMDFEDGMAKIYTIAMDGAEPYEKMHDEIVQLSNDTGFALDDLAEATYQTVSASVPATEAVEFMTHATKLARAGYTSTTKAVDILTTIMNSYGKDVYDVAYISDVLLKTQNDGKLVIDDLASTLGMIIPLASNYNVGLEQIAASYATMTKQGVPASKATTFLRAVFTELEKESSDVADILMDKTGKSFAQLMDDGNDLSDVLRILYKYAGKDAENFQRLFGNVRATQAVAALVTDDFSILDYELERVTDSSGQTDRALEQMETTQLKAKRAANQLKNSAMDLGEEIIDVLTPAFEDAVGGIREMTDGFLGLRTESKRMIIAGGAIAAATGPVILGLGKVATYIGALIAGTASLNPLLIGGAISLVAGFTSVAVKTYEATEAYKDQLHATYDLSEETKNQIQKIKELEDAHVDFKASMQSQTTEILNNKAVAEQLVTQYNNLVDSSGKIAEKDQALADTILNQLAQALGLNKEDIQELIDKNGKLSGAIQQTIEDYEKQAYMAVYAQQLQEATERLVESQRIERELAEATDLAYKNLRDTNHEMVAAKQAITDAEEKGLPVTEEMWEQYRLATDAYDYAEQAVRELSTAQIENRTAMNDAEDDIEFYTDKMRDVGVAEDEAGEKAKENGKEIRDESEKTATAIENNIKNIDTDTTTKYMMTGLANGIAKYQYLAERAAARAGSATATALNNSVQVASPSKLTFETGKYFVEGFANAINSGISELSDMGYMLGQSASSGLSMGSYMPEYGNVTNNKTISAPISISLTVNGNVDNSEDFTRRIAQDLADLLQNESEVFA